MPRCRASDRSPETGLGVGITYAAAIEPLLDRRPELFGVVEIEPQTLWRRRPDGGYLVEPGLLDHLAALPGRKLVHSIGTPVGGTRLPEPEQLRLLAETIEALDAAWLSDHLSFNQTPEFATGFFLPPRQTRAGVQAVTHGITALKDAVPVPVLIETGVNYLRRRDDELADGFFVAAVAEGADCGLLLDLHNVFTNALNGRQAVDEFVDSLPLERVREVHLAGGMELDGFWLDAHSGAIPEPLFAICEQIVPRLVNLDAIVFEIFPSFVPAVGLDLVCAQIDRLHDLWRLRRTDIPSAPRPIRLDVNDQGPTPEAWERALGALVIGRSSTEVPNLADDPGVRVVQGLIHEFRASMIVGVLRLTARLLLLSLGPDAFRTLLNGYWLETPPQMYAASEADAFADYLTRLNLEVPHLRSILAFEQAVIATLADGERRVVAFDFEPLPLLRALAESRLPEGIPEAGRFEIELTPDGPTASIGLERDALETAFPFH